MHCCWWKVSVLPPCHHRQCPSGAPWLGWVRDAVATPVEERAALRARDAAAFAGVSRFVARVKCAMLGWVAAEEALDRAG